MQLSTGTTVTSTSCRYVENTKTPWEALAGVNSDTPSGVHGWNANNVNPKLHPECRSLEMASHGDGRIIDTWARSGEAREWSGTFTPETPSITLTKTVTEKTYGDTATELHWTYTATNTGNVPLTNVHIIDDTYDGGYTGTDPNTVNTVTEACATVQPGNTCTWKDITSPLVDSDFPDAGEPIATSAPTDAQGLTKVSGLQLSNWYNGAEQTDLHSYCLVESKAPEGYNLLPSPVKFDLTVAGEVTDMAAAFADAQRDADTTDNAGGSRTIVDSKKQLLPFTGGAGIGVIGSAATIMAGAAGFFAFRSRRNSKQGETA